MTPQEVRLTKSPIFFIDKAIDMLKDEYKDEPLIAGYNGIVCALGYAKDSAAKDKERIKELEGKLYEVDSNTIFKNETIANLTAEVERLRQQLEKAEEYIHNKL